MRAFVYLLFLLLFSSGKNFSFAFSLLLLVALFTVSKMTGNKGKRYGFRSNRHYPYSRILIFKMSLKRERGIFLPQYEHTLTFLQKVNVKRNLKIWSGESYSLKSLLLSKYSLELFSTEFQIYTCKEPGIQYMGCKSYPRCVQIKEK